VRGAIQQIEQNQLPRRGLTTPRSNLQRLLKTALIRRTFVKVLYDTHVEKTKTP
jgi:2-polyprenyl-6-methoxyphenol hydroxylase-like FAD-dependent oxidoreductase